MYAQRGLNGSAFIELLRAGHRLLQDKVQVVNALNVFPVPDGDTGTNMELSFASGIAKFNTSADWSLASAAQAFASGLLMGARGNSGVILSQLFRGFLKVTHKLDELDAVSFASALHEGVQIAYRAVAKPVEGTILTVAKEAAAAGLRSANEKSLPEWMSDVVAAAQRALARTPDQLPVLKQAGVVDSGGQGLVFIFEGFAKWLRGERSVDLSGGQNLVVPDKLEFAGAKIEHEAEFGYCTEVLVRTAPEDAQDAETKLRKTLATYGNSMLVVSAEDLVKVHVHTLHPGRVLEDALKLGTLVKIKVENMTEQHTAIREQAQNPPDIGLPVAQQLGRKRSEHDVAGVVAVVAGEGLQEIFVSLGADIVVGGGQTMNPSTEELVAAVNALKSEYAIILPNNKNIVLAAEQAQSILGDRVDIIPTATIPQGICALMACRKDKPRDLNVERMNHAIGQVKSGQVVRAVRNSVYQGQTIEENQYLGLVEQTLCQVGNHRVDVAAAVVAAMAATEAELLTIFYGTDVDELEASRLASLMRDEHHIEVETRCGGQPVYDYIFALE